MIYTLGQVGMAYTSEADLAEVSQGWSPTEAEVQREIDIMRGSWSEQQELRVKEAALIQTLALLAFVIWRVSGLMLVGMALYQWGVLSGKASSGSTNGSP